MTPDQEPIWKKYHLKRNSVSEPTDVLSQLHLHPLHGDAPQQSVLLRGQPHEGSDRTDAAQLWDAAGAHLYATAGPIHPSAQSVTGQLPVSTAGNQTLTRNFKCSNSFVLKLEFIIYYSWNCFVAWSSASIRFFLDYFINKWIFCDVFLHS